MTYIGELSNEDIDRMTADKFEMHFYAEEPEPRTRWNGGPLPSAAAATALLAAVGVAQQVLIEHGFRPTRLSYGVTAVEGPQVMTP